MVLDQVCRKKDKRLLVLFAFGAMILLSDTGIIPAGDNPGGHSYSWVEVRENNSRLFRFNLNKHSIKATSGRLSVTNGTFPVQLRQTHVDSLKKKKAIALKKEPDDRVLPVSLSPRLAFLLGQPFSINIAGSEELELVPGIGPNLAGNIIAYRKEQGPLTNAHQLEAVRGIGPRMKQRLQHYFTYADDPR
ncbi:MAG TPA: helix-hairpin-helix domain-containing protein [Desulfobacteraceae bacterium]|nr:helix-hairpin-helix domain-containing protein [Desulfobacteraceae bacterium]